MHLALEWATADHPEHSLAICTDSQSSLKAIERRSPVTRHLKSLLNARPAPTILLSVLGQKGIPGNDAKTAAKTTSDTPGSILYASARSFICRTLTDPPPGNSPTGEVCCGFTWSKDCMAISNNADEALLARL